jgi:hypothetical protein
VTGDLSKRAGTFRHLPGGANGMECGLRTPESMERGLRAPESMERGLRAPESMERVAR